MKLNVIFLGTSHPHIFHRFTYLQARSGTIKLLGYYDHDAQVAEQMQKHTCCPRYADLGELMSLPYDIALIHGRDAENPEYIHRAIKSGAKGLLVEKPGAAQPSAFYPLVPEIRERGIVFEVGWELHYLETVEFARRIVKDEVLGPITEARFHGGCPGGAGDEPWQSDSGSIGGFFYSLGGHVVESVVDLFGLPRHLVSSIRKLPVRPPHEGFSWVPNLFSGRQLNPEKMVGGLAHEDIASAILEYGDFNVHLDFTAWEPCAYLKDWTIDIYGVGGSLHLNLDGPGSSIVLKTPVGTWKAGRNSLFTGEYAEGEMLAAAFKKQMDSFFHRVQAGLEDGDCCNDTMAAKLLKLYDALYESAQTRSWVSMSM
jgi:predicted dehydrogenase